MCLCVCEFQIFCTTAGLTANSNVLSLNYSCLLRVFRFCFCVLILAPTKGLWTESNHYCNYPYGDFQILAFLLHLFTEYPLLLWLSSSQKEAMHKPFTGSPLSRIFLLQIRYLCPSTSFFPSSPLFLFPSPRICCPEFWAGKYQAGFCDVEKHNYTVYPEDVRHTFNSHLHLNALATYQFPSTDPVSSTIPSLGPKHAPCIFFFFLKFSFIRKTEKETAFCWFIPQIPTTAEYQKLHLGLRHGWQEPKHMSHTCCTHPHLPGCILAGKLD